MKKIIFITTLSAALILSACNDSAEEEVVGESPVEEEVVETVEAEDEARDLEKVEEVSDAGEEVDETVEEEVTSEKFQIGDSATIDGITLTLDDAYLTDERNDSSIIEVQDVLVLDVTYENNTANVFPAGRDIIVEVGGELARSYALEGTLLADLPPGESISGRMAYGLISSPDDIVAIFEPLLNTTGERAIFDVTVE